MRGAARPLAVMVTLVGLAACSSEEPTGPQAEASFCQATDRLGNAVDALTDDGAELTERDELMDAIGSVEDAVTDVAEARTDEGQNPIDQFNARLEAIPDDATPTEAAAETARAGGELLADLKVFLDPPDCP